MGHAVLALKIALIALLPTARSDANQILDLASQTDVIVLGEASAAPSAKANTVEFWIRSDSVVKGAVHTGSSVKAVFAELKGGVFSGLVMPVRPPSAGTYGLWFLKSLDSGSYSAIPREGREGLTSYTRRAVVKLPKYWLPPVGASVEQLLLEAALEAYRHDNSNENLLIQSLQYSVRFGDHRSLSLGVVDKLLDSSTPAESDLGILIGVRMSYDRAAARLERELGRIWRDQRMMGHLIAALTNHFDPSSREGAARVEKLIRQNRKTQIAGIDLALAKSLRKANNKEMLSLAALLLDSSDSEAVRRASHQFYVYAMTTVKDSFFNEGFRSHNGLNEATSATENAEFWREWWADNQADLGGKATRLPR